MVMTPQDAERGTHEVLIGVPNLALPRRGQPRHQHEVPRLRGRDDHPDELRRSTTWLAEVAEPRESKEIFRLN